MPQNILITGVGAIIGYGIIESLKNTNTNFRIIGTDIYEENYGKYLCDKFYVVPLTNSNSYLNYISEIIENEKIDLVFPGIEQDVFFFSENRHEFEVKIVLNSKRLIDLCKNKFDFYNFLKKKSFSGLIPTYKHLTFSDAKKKLGLPFIIKPSESYAGKGFFVVKSEDVFEKIKNEINSETLFQKYVGSLDDEYTISLFGDGKGSYLDIFILRRYLSKAGASEKVFTVNDDSKFIIFCKKICEIFKPDGPTNIQVRMEDDRLYLLEINPRVSSAVSIRTKFGYNEAYHCINYFFNKPLIIENKKKGKAIRFIAERIIYEG